MTHGESIAAALELIPHSEFLLTAAAGRRSNGVLVDFVGQCANNPPMLVVATAKGQVLTPIIRDSRCFVVSLITDATRPLARRFNGSSVEVEDPFIGLPTGTTSRGNPILDRTVAWFECELSRHFDIDADCELYVGTIVDVMVSDEAREQLEKMVPPTHVLDTKRRSPGRGGKKSARRRVLVESS